MLLDNRDTAQAVMEHLDRTSTIRGTPLRKLLAQVRISSPVADLLRLTP
jgi:hypothetical protein